MPNQDKRDPINGKALSRSRLMEAIESASAFLDAIRHDVEEGRTVSRSASALMHSAIRILGESERLEVYRFIESGVYESVELRPSKKMKTLQKIPK